MQELFLLSSLPVGQLVALGVFGVIVTLLVGRIVLNSFPGKCPPVFEGVPFIGGLFKFMQVSSTPADIDHWLQTPGLTTHLCDVSWIFFQPNN